MKKLYLAFTQLALCAYTLSLSALHYTLQDLGTLESQQSLVNKINNNNTVIGIQEDSKDLSYFSWHPLNGLVSFPERCVRSIPFINNQDQIAGLFWHQTDYWFAENFTSKNLFIREPNQSFTSIGYPEKWKDEQQKIEKWQTPNVWDNNKLSIVSFNDSGQLFLTDSTTMHKSTKIAVWQNATFHYLDSSKLSHLYAANNSGLMLGRRWIENEQGKCPMLGIYDFNQDTFYPIMKDVNIISYAMNDRGQVILVKEHLKALEGLLWDIESGFTTLTNFYPVALNNKDQMIGLHLQDETPLFALWNKGEIIDLGKMLDLEQSHTAWVRIKTLKGINDNGYIIGEGQYDGKTHAFVLIPSKNE